MIRVVVDKYSLKATGHANFDEYGKDIVCAAVSSILQHAAYILEDLGARVVVKKGDLMISEIPNDDCAKRVLKATVGALSGIQRKYPENLYLEVKENGD